MKRAPALALLAAGCVSAPQPAPLPPEPVAAAPVVPPRLTVSGAAVQGGVLRGIATGGALALDGAPVEVAADGAFLVAFDRDAGPRALLTLIGRDGARVDRPIAVAPRAWPIERVDAPYRAGKTDAEFAAARPAEVAAIAAARATVTDAAGWRAPLAWPASGRLSGRFGAQRVYRGEPGSYHSGADVAVPTGTPVTAPGDGVVILAASRPFTLEGRLLMIDHGAGLNSALLHLSRIDVSVGQRVRQGQVVGLSGATGRVSGPHLHWGLRWRDAKLDPLLVAGMPPGSVQPSGSVARP